jgi:hypothetical protein
MSLIITLLTASTMMGVGEAAEGQVVHPEVSCWTGLRTWTAANEVPSQTVVYDTAQDVEPFLITHKRDQIRDKDGLVQDYNFIDYWFGQPASPIHARHYLGDNHVYVDVPVAEGERLSIETVQAYFPSDVLCYLQKRFDRIEVLVDGGYRELWSKAQ